MPLTEQFHTIFNNLDLDTRSHWLGVAKLCFNYGKKRNAEK